MHDIQELKRQYEQAQQKATEALLQRDRRMADYHAALIADAETMLKDRGVVPGVKVRHDGSTGIYVGCEVGTYRHDVRVVVMKEKADGTAHAKARVLGFHFADPRVIWPAARQGGEA